MNKKIVIGAIGGWLFLVLLTFTFMWDEVTPKSHAQLAAISGNNATLFNQTAVQVSAAVSTDQNLQQLTEFPGSLNYVGKVAHIRWSGTVTSGASANGTWTIKLKICTVSGCGSGTAVTLLTFGPTGTQVASATNAPWDCDAYVVTVSTGASGTLNSWGVCRVETTSTTLQTDSPAFVAVNTAASSAIDLTAQLFWQGTLADSGSSANNVINGRYMVRVFEN
jgi:hypothetical protein